MHNNNLLITMATLLFLVCPVSAQGKNNHGKKDKVGLQSQISEDTLPLSLSSIQEERHLQTRCDKNEKVFILKITTDDYGFETSWQLKKKKVNRKWETIEFGPPLNSNYADNTPYFGSYCLSPGRYAIVVNDLFEDGMCCIYGDGEYAGYVNGAEQFSSVAGKWKQKVHAFTVAQTQPQTTTPRPTRRPTRRPTPPASRPSPALPGLGAPCYPFYLPGCGRKRNLLKVNGTQSD